MIYLVVTRKEENVMNTYPFRGKQLSYDLHWLDDFTFIFDFGDGDLYDEDGDSYFIHCEYHTDDDTFEFEIWYECCTIDFNPSNEFLTLEEKEEIMKFMKDNLY